MDRLKGKVAVVTGSTSGIGIGIAREFAAEGAHVVVCGRREARGQEVVDQIGADGGSASFHRMDLTDLSTVDALMADTARDYGSIDVNRYGSPADIAHACTYFASDESAYVTGQVINVDGGLNSHAPTVAQFRSAGSRTW